MGTMIEHVAIIMDGVRRWARERAVSPAEGWEAGLRAAGEVVRAAAEAGVGNLTLFAPEEEAAAPALVSALGSWRDAGLRLRYVGRGSLPEADLAALEQAERTTADAAGMALNLALDYDGRIELTDAAASVAADIEEGRLAPEQADEQHLARRLYRPEIPDIDLLIRSGGESHLAGFMLWQTAYAEIVFSDALWPDFTPADFRAALDEFGRRVRKFGAVDTI